MTNRYDEQYIRVLLEDLLGDRFLDVKILELPKLEHINLLVKTTKEVDWGSEFGTEDCPLWEYLNGLEYRRIMITPATSFEGAWLI